MPGDEEAGGVLVVGSVLLLVLVRRVVLRFEETIVAMPPRPEMIPVSMPLRYAHCKAMPSCVSKHFVSPTVPSGFGKK